jgi:2-furoyl-CoA dehydrogenase FAD binding subunit
MITEYNRPADLAEALALLGRAEPMGVESTPTYPLAGGASQLWSQLRAEKFAVVDLQALGLDTIQTRGNFLDLGAMVTLQNLLEARLAVNLPTALAQAIEHEASYNLRQAATVAGTLVAANGRSPFATACLALDAELLIQPDHKKNCLGDLLPLRAERLLHCLITQVTIPLNVRLAYQYVARTPADQPIVCAALAVWPAGRMRLALGGFGPAPVLALDGPQDEAGAAGKVNPGEALKLAAQSAYSQAQDVWASAAYRQEIASILAQRCLEQVT